LFLFLIGIVFLPGRSRGTLLMREFIDRASVGIPSEPGIEPKTLVFANPPHLPFVAYPMIERAALHCRARMRFIRSRRLRHRSRFNASMRIRFA
jgi:hypothetical protein